MLHIFKSHTERGYEPHYFLPHHGVLKHKVALLNFGLCVLAQRPVPVAESSLSHWMMCYWLDRSCRTIFATYLYISEFKICFFLCHPPNVWANWNTSRRPEISIHTLAWITLSSSVYILVDHSHGINCSTFFASKTLQQLANDEVANFSQAAEILKHYSCVDNLIAGASTVKEAS